MPSELVAALLAPLRELQSMVGDGRLAASIEDPAGQLRVVGSGLAELATTGRRAMGVVRDGWSGQGAGAAGQFFATAFSAVDDVGTRSSALAGRVDAASDAVGLAHADLQRIVDDFTSTAHALEPGLPATAGALADAARRALDDALGVVARLEGELDTHAAAVSGHATPSAPAPPTGTAAATPPAMAPPGAMAPGGMAPAGMLTSAVSSLGGAAQGLAGSTLGMLGTLAPVARGFDPAASASASASTPASLLDRGGGDGVAVRLPGGSTAAAPNAVAASAVQHALSQIGVPYHWGGTTPDVGLDCSGLTQWAYREAGLDLPRLAQEQDVGTAVSPNALMPGDLAVWDGHVAMVVGDGMMVEAGDPVQLSPIRTSNAGQGFQGFWRPTA